MGCKQQDQSSGLAYLAHLGTQPHHSTDAASQTALLLDYVYQLPQSASDVVSKAGEIKYPELNARVQEHIAKLKQEATAVAASAAAAGPSSGASISSIQEASADPAWPSSSSSSHPAAAAAAEQPRGRVGPRDVAIDRSSVCGSFGFSTDGLTLEALGNFTSCRANTAVFAGKWFYECTVLTSGIQQVCSLTLWVYVCACVC